MYISLQDPSETLGISVAGGLDSPRGDTPIYVTNINPSGCLGKTKQIKVSHYNTLINSQWLVLANVLEKGEVKNLILWIYLT